MKTLETKSTDQLDRYGHLHSDELRQSVIEHYVHKFHGGNEAELWVAGTGGATTRQEKVEILGRIKRRNP